MKKRGRVEFLIGINETEANFNKRLTERYNGYLHGSEIAEEARYQCLKRDIEMAKTVTQLQPVLLRMVEEMFS